MAGTLPGREAAAKGMAGQVKPKNEKGQFKERLTQRDGKALLGQSLDKQRKRLGRETDADALDEVRPTGQSAGADKDRGGKDPAATTSKATDEHSSKGATGEIDEQKLAAAHQALKLDGWTEDDFRALTPQRVIDLGQRAIDRQRERGKELRERSGDANAAASASKDATTKKDEPKGEAKRASSTSADFTEEELETIIREDFDEFDATEVKPWVKAISKVARRLLGGSDAAFEARASKVLEKQLGEAKASLTETQAVMRAEAEFDRAVDVLTKEYPELDKEDGRVQLAKRIGQLRKGGDTKSIRTLVIEQARALWGDEREKRLEEERRNSEEASARENGTFAVTAATGLDRKKGPKQLLGESFDRLAARRRGRT